MKKKVNALVPAAAVLVILCAAYGLITWHQHRKADELPGAHFHQLGKRRPGTGF